MLKEFFFTAYLFFGRLLCLQPPHLLPLLPHLLLQAHPDRPSANHLSLTLSRRVECDSAVSFDSTHFSLVGLADETIKADATLEMSKGHGSIHRVYSQRDACV